MATNLAIDDSLLVSAQRIGRHRTKKAAVTEALEEYILRRQQLKAVALFGTVSFRKRGGYKVQRRRG